MQQERWHCGNRKGLKKQLDFEQVFKAPAHPSKAISKSSAQWSSDETPHSVPRYPIDCWKNIGKKIKLSLAKKIPPLNKWMVMVVVDFAILKVYGSLI